MQKVALNINFDSLFFPLDIDRTTVRDPSYFVVADRFFAEINRRNIRCSIFVIARDLENVEVAARVRSWAEAGHEIGNHTWSHHHNLGGLPRERMRDEIVRAHSKITEVVGIEPRGFIAPAWSTSTEVVAVLRELKYLYDTSIFPSPVIAPAMMKLQVNGRKQQRYNASWWQRNDKRAAFFAPRNPYFMKDGSLVRRGTHGLIQLPLPTYPVVRFPCWQTMAFYVGPQRTKQLIQATAAHSDAFYYLMHPADITDFVNDVPEALRMQYADEFALFERLTVPFARKQELFIAALEALTAIGPCVTLAELASDAKIRLTQPT